MALHDVSKFLQSTLLWNLFGNRSLLNCKLIPIVHYVCPFGRNTYLYDVRTRLQTHRWAEIRKQFKFLGGEGTKHEPSTKHARN
jgi:hypothetical protein